MVDERTDCSRGANDDDITTDVRRRGEKILRMVNVYDQPCGQSGERERPGRKLNWQIVITPTGTILTGEFNTHCTQWDPRCQVQRNAAFWDDVIDENGLEISVVNRPVRPTSLRTGRDGGLPSVLS